MGWVGAGLSIRVLSTVRSSTYRSRHRPDERTGLAFYRMTQADAASEDLELLRNRDGTAACRSVAQTGIRPSRARTGRVGMKYAVTAMGRAGHLPPACPRRPMALWCRARRSRGAPPGHSPALSAESASNGPAAGFGSSRPLTGPASSTADKGGARRCRGIRPDDLRIVEQSDGLGLVELQPDGRPDPPDRRPRQPGFGDRECPPPVHILRRSTSASRSFSVTPASATVSPPRPRRVRHVFDEAEHRITVL
ncbi:MAG: hypothetical protein QOJ30_5070 [Pseudonocardiales bacterium]|nr:hypothetical protein [Pseudonocardiales bacterium]